MMNAMQQRCMFSNNFSCIRLVKRSHYPLKREIDGKVYKASVKEKEKAQTEYQNAVDSGQSAAQVTTR